MKYMNHYNWIGTIGAFIGALYAYSLFSYFGVASVINAGVIQEYFDSNVWHVEVILGGILFGTLFILIHRLTERPVFRKRSFGFNILLKSVLYLVMISGVSLVMFPLFVYLDLITKAQLKEFVDLVTFPFVLSFGLYCCFFIVLMNFLFYINKKFGPGFLIDIFLGKYYHPRNENLIFLFLDLKGSTMLAEKLGPTTYSRFIKECIHELTPIIQKYNAQVYQYVGDEVILLWDMKYNFNHHNCVNAFFEFTASLREKEEYFMKKYGAVPIYKAGMDAGEVTITEIGDIKREIAFHGDVLNTASRLERKCNEFNEQLIVSQHVTEQLNGQQKYQFKFLSDLPLRGKSRNVRFYSVVA